MAETLAETGFEPMFVSASGTTSTVPALGGSGFPVFDCKDDMSIGQAGSQLFPPKVRAAIIDGYHFDLDLERQARSHAETVVVCEDLPNRSHDCDILVDPTPGRSGNEYDDLVPVSTQLLVGSNYALLGRKWRDVGRLHMKSKVGLNGTKRILVSMGATDPSNATASILDALATLESDFTGDVILGDSALHIDDIRRRCRDSNLSLLVNPPDLAERVAMADLAIGAPGSSTFERAVLGIPSVVIPTAGNQIDNAKALQAAGAARVVPSSMLDFPSKLGALIGELLGDVTLRRNIGLASRKLCDGRGTYRLLCVLAGQCTARDGASLGLRLADEDDSDWLLELQSAPPTRRFARNTSIPTPEEHRDWFDNVIKNPDRILAIVIDRSEDEPGRDQRLGFVRLDRILGAASPSFDVSIAISPHLHGRGYASAALYLARRMAPGSEIYATVLDENEASRALFLGAGYHQVDKELYRSVPA